MPAILVEQQSSGVAGLRPVVDTKSVIVPLLPLRPGTYYDVEFRGTVDGQPLIEADLGVSVAARLVEASIEAAVERGAAGIWLGVIAIIITIMVLELKVPHGADLAALRSVLPVFLTYVLSFVYIGIYWNNHHHMLHVTRHVDGAILWANLHLLF